MYYCCSSVLWSRVNNSHTHVVNLDVNDETIPPLAYQCAMVIKGRGCLKLHVGKTPSLTVAEWDMDYLPKVFEK